jgi:hypothetical protein
MTDSELIDAACKNATKILEVDYDKIKDKLSLVRIYFSLSHLLGGDESLMKCWVKTYNENLGCCPIDDIEGDKTSDVLTYLEGNLFL